MHCFNDEIVQLNLPVHYCGWESPARLLRVSENIVVDDYSKALSVSKNQLLVSAKNLLPGEYKLQLKGEWNSTVVRVIDRKTAKHVGQWVISGSKFYQYQERATKALSITADQSDSQLKIQLENFNHPATRVHVVCSQFLPVFSQEAQINNYTSLYPDIILNESQISLYTSGRELSDEYRYIIDRKYIKQYPQLLLDKPTLLSMPWARAEVKDTQGFANSGRLVQQRCSDGERSRMLADMKELLNNCSDSSCLDFLANGSVILSNLKPDEKGTLLIPFDSFNQHGGQCVQVIALDDYNVAASNLLIPNKSEDLKRIDLRLQNSLGLDSNFIEKEQISVVSPSTSLTFQEGVSDENFEVFDSLSKLFTYYNSKLSGSSKSSLRLFNFIVDWHSLEFAEKQKKFAEFACHEFNFFLFNKDIEFFNSTVRPHIELKRNKSFFDFYLLRDEAALQEFVVPWRLQSLNIVEKILLAYVLQLEPLAQNIIDQVNSQQKKKEPKYDITATSFRVPHRRRRSISRNFDSCDFSSEEPNFDSFTYRTPSVLDDEPQRKKKAKENQETTEYEEQHYYKVSLSSSSPKIDETKFWGDYLKFLLEKSKKKGENILPFLTRNIVEIGDSFSSVLFGFSVLDLPNVCEAPEIQFNSLGSMTSIKSRSTSLVVRYKELVNVPFSTTGSEAVSIVQCIYRDGSPNKFLSPSDDFLPGCAYTSRIVVMNSSTETKEIEALFQIPEGSILFGEKKPTSFIRYTIGPYSTEVFEVNYYFPSCGTFNQFPPQVSVKGIPVAKAEHRSFSVVERLTNVERNWQFVSRFGSDSEVLKMLQTLNSFQNDVSLISWRLNKVELYNSVISLLRSRHLFYPSIWAWSFTHHDVKSMKEYLESRDNIDTICGPILDSSILSIDPKERNTYHHREYDPLVNIRVHLFGARRKLLNDGLRKQYIHFLDILCYKVSLSVEDHLELCYFLLLMDRHDEAVNLFASINWTTQKVSPLDEYFIAYMFYLRGEFNEAKKLAMKHKDSPILRLQTRFCELLKQIEEVISNHILLQDTETSEEQKQSALSFSVKEKSLIIEYQNVEEVVVSYYMMDIELLFSSNPFMMQQGSNMGQFAYVKPNHVDKVKVPKELFSFQVDVPEKFVNSNIMIEISANGIHKSCPYFSHSMRVQFSYTKGLLQVTSLDNKPLAATYVKVYSKGRNDAVFYKDGYSDPRGIFNYLSVTSSSNSPNYGFSILLISAEHGSVIHEIPAPIIS